MERSIEILAIPYLSYLYRPIAQPVSEHPHPIPEYFQSFQSDIEGIALPERFNYPFHYVPHELALVS